MLHRAEAVDPLVTAHALAAPQKAVDAGNPEVPVIENTRLSFAWILAELLVEFRQNSATLPLRTNTQLAPVCGWVVTAPESPVTPVVGTVIHDLELPVAASVAVNCCVNVLFCRTLRLNGVMFHAVDVVVVNAALVAAVNEPSVAVSV